MPAILKPDRVDLLSTLQAYQKDNCQAGSYGAMASFIGSMRDFNAGDTVSLMTLEYYPEMTQHYLDELCQQSIDRWQLVDALIIHRYGDLQPGDDIVLVACWSAHRAQAFDACRQMMELLKSEAPFWKKEITDQGERWVHDAPNDDD